MDLYFVQGIITHQSHYFDVHIVLEWESIQPDTHILLINAHHFSICFLRAVLSLQKNYTESTESSHKPFPRQSPPWSQVMN